MIITLQLNAICGGGVAFLTSISSTFYTHVFDTKVLCAAFFYSHVTREKMPKRLSYEKGA